MRPITFVLLSSLLTTASDDLQLAEMVAESQHLQQIIHEQDEQWRDLTASAARIRETPQIVPWTRSAWCDLLVNRMSWLLAEAHAPILAQRMACSLEQCSGESQHLFAQMLHGWRSAQTPSAQDVEGESTLLAPFAAERAEAAAQYLHSHQGGLPTAACGQLAVELLAPSHTARHEKTFVLFLACLKASEQEYGK